MKVLSLSLFVSSYIFFFSSRKVHALESENIIGGYRGDIRDFPYQVSIIADHITCAGGIIGDQFVITAAHCVVDKENRIKDFVTVLGGITDWEKDKDSIFKIEYKVKEFCFPKKFFEDESHMTADIAVLKVAEKFDFASNLFVRKLDLPSVDENYVIKTAVLASFGTDNLLFKPYYDFANKLKFSGSSSRRLHYTKANVIWKEPFDFVSTINEDKIYAQVEQTNTDVYQMPDGTCFGDSGSPLVHNNTIIGVLCSGPYDCDERFNPSTYMNIIHHKAFIEKVLSGHCDSSFMYCVVKI